MMMNNIQNTFVFLLALLAPCAPTIIGFVQAFKKKFIHVRSFNETFDSATKYPILDFIGLVEQHGYTAEEHNVTTDDGYILRLHRISGSHSKPKKPGKPVFFLQHGIGLASDCWVLIGPQSDLAFLLVDAGYDVWLGNVRGNAYSRSHITKNPDDADFWEFSYHEMAIYDLKSFIDRILAETGVKNLTYYGYSMGTTMSYVLLSTYPEYNAKINLLYSAAPVAFWKYERRRFWNILALYFNSRAKPFIEAQKFNEFFPRTAIRAYIGDHYCDDHHIFTQYACAQLTSYGGADLRRLNKTALPNIYAHFPAGVSKYTLYHYNENHQKQSFAAYDYGTSKNLEKYGQKIAPVYDLSKVTAPTSIFYAKSDDVVNVKDVKTLVDLLPNVISLTAVKHPQFNHFDFLWATDAKEELYDLIIK